MDKLELTLEQIQGLLMFDQTGARIKGVGGLHRYADTPDEPVLEVWVEYARTPGDSWDDCLIWSPVKKQWQFAY